MLCWAQAFGRRYLTHIRIIQRINESAAAVLALDLPSGVDPNTGAVAGAHGAVRASMTVTFVGRKIGLYTGAGKGFVGDLHVADLGIADLSNHTPGQATLLTCSTSYCPHYRSIPISTNEAKWSLWVEITVWVARC